jgi:hypothetical protein
MYDVLRQKFAVSSHEHKAIQWQSGEYRSFDWEFAPQD